jgi:hypothetical protein
VVRVAVDRVEHGIDAPVRVTHVRAARVERAAAGQVDQRRRAARDRHQLVLAPDVHARDRAQQAPRVRMLGPVEDRVGVTLLDDPAGVHDCDLVGHLRDDAEVVRDHYDRGVELALQTLDQLEDLRLDRDVERGGRLIGDQQLRVVCQRHRDHRALAHAAGELVGIGVGAPARLRDADEAEHLDRAVVRLRLADVPVRLDRLDDLGAHLVEGVQRRQGVLEDHRDLVAADRAQIVVGRAEQLLAVEAHGARDAGVARAGETHDRQRRDRLARTGLAHDAERLATIDGVRDAVDGLDEPVLGLEVDAEVLDLEQRLGHQ